MQPGSEVPFLDGMDFGTGINTLTLTTRGQGVADVNGTAPSPILGGAGDTTVFQLQRTESVEDFYSAMDLSTSVTATMGMFGGNATFDFAESKKFHSFSQYLVASISVTKAFTKIPKPRLDSTSDAGALLANGNIDRFKEEFGDMFVLGARMGGAYYAVFEFMTESEEDSQQLSATLDAGEFGLFSTSDSFSQTISTFKGKSSLKVTSFQTGGEQQGQETNIDAIIEKAKNFATEMGDKGVPFTALLQDYTSLPLPAPPNFIDVQAAADVLANYATMRTQIIQRLNDVTYVQLHPEQFVNAGAFDLAGISRQLTDALNQLKANASMCVNSVKDCKFSEVTLPTVTLPARVPGATVAVPNWVGLDFNIFRDPPSAHPDVVFPETIGLTLGFRQHPVNDMHLDSQILSTAPPAGVQVPKGSNVTADVGIFDG